MLLFDLSAHTGQLPVSKGRRENPLISQQKLTAAAPGRTCTGAAERGYGNRMWIHPA